IAQIPCSQAVETLIQLHAVSAYVLHRRRPDRTWNKRQVLQTVPAMTYAMRHEIMPGLTRLRLDYPFITAFVDQPYALRLYLDDQAAQLRCKHNIAAAAQHHHLVMARRHFGQLGYLVRRAVTD